MEQIKVKAKKWGNSIAVVIPANVVNKESITDGMEITITVQPKRFTTVGDLMEFGRKLKLKNKLKRSTQELMDEVDKDLWPEDE